MGLSVENGPLIRIRMNRVVVGDTAQQQYSWIGTETATVYLFEYLLPCSLISPSSLNTYEGLPAHTGNCDKEQHYLDTYVTPEL